MDWRARRFARSCDEKVGGCLRTRRRIDVFGNFPRRQLHHDWGCTKMKEPDHSQANRPEAMTGTHQDAGSIDDKENGSPQAPRQWSTPRIGPERKLSGPFHLLQILGYRQYTLPGGNPLTGKLSPNSKVSLSSFGKVPVELNSQGLYRGITKWTTRRWTTSKRAKVWEDRGENQLIRTGKISAFPNDAAALIAFDCDAETPEEAAAFLAILERKFGRLSLRRRAGKPHRWLALVKGIDGAGELQSIRVIYTDRDGNEARMEILIVVVNLSPVA
jgi:hypothetical protein